MKKWRSFICAAGCILLLMGCIKQIDHDTEEVFVETQEALSTTGFDESAGEPELMEESVAESVEESVEEKETEPLHFEKDGRQYQKVEDLITGQYLWASVLTQGVLYKDEHGCESIDHNSEKRSFVCLDSMEEIPVRRWDNLYYSAGEYLVFEYDGTMHVSKSSDLYHPVLSYDVGTTYGIIFRVPGGYMTADVKSYIITFYNEKFETVKIVEGYRAMERGNGFYNGLMAVRDMKTGLMGFMDQAGDIVIPCQYGNTSHFSNGYASVLVGAEMVSYTEDGGTVDMYYGKGGQWGIIDGNGGYVLEPSKQYANEPASQSEEAIYYDGYRGFTLVRQDGTADFVANDEDGRVIETVRVKER